MSYQQIRFTGSEPVHAIAYGFATPRTRCGLSMTTSGHRRVPDPVTCRKCIGRTPKRGAS